MRKFMNVMLVLVGLLGGSMDVYAQDKAPGAAAGPFSAALEQQADEYLQGLQDDLKPSASKAGVLKHQMAAARAYYTGDYYSVVYEFQQVLKDNPKDLQAWVMLAETLGRKELASDKENAKKAVFAAVNAYRLATDPVDKVAILQLLNTINPDFHGAYLAGLKTTDKKKVDERFALLTADYPKVFAFYDVEIPDKSDVGTACISFSKPLLKLKSFAYEDYISVSPQVKDLSVVAKGNRLCLTGLTFGAAYKVTLKKGLSGEGSYKLAEDQTIDLLIKHRKPSIVFRERGYILPAKGPQLLPLKAVNVPSVKIQVFQVPLQNLPQVLNQNDFPGQTSPWRLEQIKNDMGDLIAEGTFDSQGNMDESIVRGLQLDKILGNQLQPGIYIVHGEAADKSKQYDGDDATQWVVISDIGLSTYSGPDGLHVSARSLATANSLAGVEVAVIARNGRALGTGKTDKNGTVQFDAGMLNGKDSNQPLFIQAMMGGKDFTFISFRKEGFDFSDRGVEGRDPVKQADAYVYTERGIYRPGDKVSIMALLRDQDGKAMQKVPLTFKIFRPDGVEAFTEVEQDRGAGAYSYELDTQVSCYSGTWTASVYLDPKGPEVGRTSFRIDDFIPPRIEVKESIKQKVIHPLDTLITDVTARYFYGPWAANLKAEGLVELVEKAAPFEKWKDYRFGLEEETWTPLRFKADPTTTNDKGEAVLQSIINIKPDTTKILAARSVATVFEAGGRGRSVTEETLFWHQSYAIGIEAQFKDKTSPGNGDASFNVIAVDEKGELKAAGDLKYTLYEETYGFTWFRSGSDWNYERSIDDKPISTGNVAVSGNEPTVLNVPVTYGYYRLEIMDPKNGVATSYRFHAGWGGMSEIPDRPDMIEMSLDKETYKPGDKAVLTMVSPFDGELEIVALDEKSYHQLHRGQATQKGTRVEIPLTAELLKKSGTYLMATVYRPGDVKTEKVAGRAVGLIWVNAKESMPKIQVSVKAPSVIHPEKEFAARVCLSKAVKNPRATVAVVDEAILQLTEFKSPDPFDYIFAQTKLAFTIRDSYGQLINPFGARPGDFKVGGDGLSQKALTKLAARTFKTVSFFSGVISDFKESKEEGCAQEATVSFKLPEFSGQVRVMAVVWDEEATGSADVSTVVRDDVETYIALPRFLAPGDQTTVILDVQNLTEGEGTFKLSLQAEGEIGLVKEFTQTLTLKKEEMVHLPIEVKAKNVGVGKLTLRVEGQGISLEKHWEIAVRSSVYEMSESTSGVLKAGESVAFGAAVRAAFKPGTGSTALSLGSVPTYGAAQLRKEMRAYPYSCLEQLTSRLVAELYAPADTRDGAKVEDILSQVVSLQQFDGPFALWSANGYAEPWLSVYALDLLSKAQGDKFDLSPAVLSRGMQWIKDRVRQDSSGNDSLGNKAYGLYLLAKQGQGSLGALKYFADNSQKNLTNRDDLAFIAGAFALYGDAASAKLWFDKAIAAQEEPVKDRTFYQSWISDTAILVAVMAETTQNHPQLMNLAAQLADMVSKNRYLSTFEKGWLIRASSALGTLAKPFKVSVGGKAQDGSKAVTVNLTPEQIQANIAVKNDGDSPIAYTLNVEGEPLDPSKFQNKGFSIAREVYTLNGQPVDMSQVKSGDLLVVVLKGELLEDNTHEVLVLDLLPSGFEIEKVKFDETYMKNNFVWLTNLTELSRVEKRDDRYMAAFRMDGKGKFVMTYFVRALNPGVYKYPSASVESMYRPEYTARNAEGVLTIKP